MTEQTDSVLLETNNLRKLHRQRDTLIKIKREKDGSIKKLLNIDPGFYVIKKNNQSTHLYSRKGFNHKVHLNKEEIIFKGK